MMGWHAITVAVLSALAVLDAISAAPAYPFSELDLVYKILKGRKMVDLTHSWGTETPVWRGFGQAKLTPAADPDTGVPYTLAKDGFRTTYYQVVGQYGTHVDPPAHFFENGTTMDNIPLRDMILPLIVLDNTRYQGADPNHAFSLNDLRDWETRHGKVPTRAFVALRTDMYKDWSSNPEYFKRYPFPGWSLEVVQFLVEKRGVAAIGHESLDTDITDTFESESYILSTGRYQIEAMTNLDKVPAKGGLLFVTWPKVENGIGFMARAIAIV